jgi:hypothetical protein
MGDVHSGASYPCSTDTKQLSTYMRPQIPLQDALLDLRIAVPRMDVHPNNYNLAFRDVDKFFTGIL